MADAFATDDEFLMTFDRDKAEEDTLEGAHLYERLLEVLIRRRSLTIKKLQAAIGGAMGLATYGSFLNQYKKFTGERRKTVLRYVFDNDLLRPSQRQAEQRVNARLFSELVDFIGIPGDTVKNAPKRLTGTYQFWRHSVAVPGAYVKGILQIFPKESVLFAETHQRYIPREPDMGTTHLKPRYEHLEGYVIRQSGGRCFLFLGDPVNRQVRICIFSANASVSSELEQVEKSPAQIQAPPIFSLTGMVMGIDNGRPFMSPLYVEKVTDEVPKYDDARMADLRNSVNIYYHDEKEREVPRKVLANLRQPLLFF